MYFLMFPLIYHHIGTSQVPAVTLLITHWQYHKQATTKKTITGF